MKLWKKILIGLILGTLTGFILGPHAIFLKPLGTIFLTMISMVIMLLILASITTGITTMSDPSRLGRVGLKTIGTYLFTTLIAITIGIILANAFQVGEELQLVAENIGQEPPKKISSILISIIPSNPIAALANGNILQVIFFAVFLGIAINFSGERGKTLGRFFESLADTMYRLTSIVMEFSPIGVFAIMAWVAGTFGFVLLLPLLKFLAVYYAACGIQVLVYCVLLRYVGKLPIAPFFKGSRDAFMTAFSTCSSAAALPVAMHCLHENLGVSKNISGFVLPLGITINMNGASIFQTMCAIFIAKAYGIPLDITSYTTLYLTAILSSLGTAGVPGGGYIMLSALLAALGLPIEGLALFAGIDRVREMVSTTLNILGDSAVAVLIAKQEGEFDEIRYLNPELVALQEAE